ncbi:MAG: hypothetical protein MJ252_26290 [archaeon]|nr:hypothetical protein [archaeon]
MSSDPQKIYEKIEIDLISFGTGDPEHMEFSEKFMIAILDNRMELSNDKVKIKLGRAFDDDSDFIKTNIDEYCSYIDASNTKKLVIILGMGITGNPNNYFLITGVEYENVTFECKFPYETFKCLFTDEGENHPEAAGYLTAYLLRGVCKKFRNNSNVIHGFIYFPDLNASKIEEYMPRFKTFIEKITTMYIKDA